MKNLQKTIKISQNTKTKRLEYVNQGKKTPAATEKAYLKYRNLQVDLLKTIHLNQTKIEELVDQLYEYHKTLLKYEGPLLRLATSYKISRDEFLEEYYGTELDPKWAQRVIKKNAKWKKFLTERHDEVLDLRKQVNDVSVEIGMPINELRRITGASTKRRARI